MTLFRSKRFHRVATEVVTWAGVAGAVVVAWVLWEHLPALLSLPSPLISTPLVPSDI